MSAASAEVRVDSAILRRILSETERNVLIMSRHVTPREVSRELGWGDGQQGKERVEEMLKRIKAKVAQAATRVEPTSPDAEQAPDPDAPMFPLPKMDIETEPEPEPDPEPAPEPEPEPERPKRLMGLQRGRSEHYGEVADRIRAYFAEHPGPATPRAVADALAPVSAGSISTRMRALAQAGELVRIRYGVYAAPGAVPPAEPEPEEPEEEEEPIAPVRLVSVPLPVDEAASRLRAARERGVDQRDVYLAILLDLVQRPDCEAHVFDRLERILSE